MKNYRAVCSASVPLHSGFYYSRCESVEYAIVMEYWNGILEQPKLL